jgi:DNA-binding transcriptional ArsR family regulator
MAALAVWEYCEDSGRFIFGTALGDPTADEILRALRRHPEGMTRNEIREHFGRNKLSGEIGQALTRSRRVGKRGRCVKSGKRAGQQSVGTQSPLRDKRRKRGISVLIA